MNCRVFKDSNTTDPHQGIWSDVYPFLLAIHNKDQAMFNILVKLLGPMLKFDHLNYLA